MSKHVFAGLMVRPALQTTCFNSSSIISSSLLDFALIAMPSANLRLLSLDHMSPSVTLEIFPQGLY